MKIQGSVIFDATPQEVWDLLLDPQVMAQCIAGCTELREIEPNNYTASVKVGVGAVSGTYQGKLQLIGKMEPSHYALVFDGKGKQGFVRGSGEAELRPVRDTTVVSYSCELELGGLIASVGQRVLKGVSGYLINEMFTRLKNHVGGGRSHETSPV